MIKKLITIALFSLSLNAVAAVENGQQAPDFKLKGNDGKTYQLSEILKDKKYVVLEWFNNECPYVEKHYGSGNMQALQKKYIAKDVRWYSVISSAEGKQGYRDAAGASATKKERGQASLATLLDPTGEVGKKYGAKTTPHMFLISPEGKVLYQGAIDSDSSYRPDSIKSAKNYIAMAIDNAMAGKAIDPAKTKAYGCSVKY
ncbi:MAG: thioredoxin family protein [Bdellovibrionaceae bacterium]|mgnify:FL=1|nr:thioredoxin family protein [Pseudobdellovibrionaceae bacterium]|tara:strand:+ start:41627 stop:42229 length:603 start_codon:yes stop_codon:yes gene_type:complete